MADLLETSRHQHPTDHGLQARARAKLVEVDVRLADLQTIRAALLEALDAGCDDLVACEQSPCCSLPFTDLAQVTARTPPYPVCSVAILRSGADEGLVGGRGCARVGP